MNMVEKKTPLASTSIWRSRCRCSGLVVFFRPNDWVTKRLARQALVAGRGLEQYLRGYLYTLDRLIAA